MNQRDRQALEMLVRHLGDMESEYVRWHTANILHTQLEIDRLLMAIETDERDLNLARQRLDRQIDLLSKLKEHLYNERQVLAAMRVAG